MATAFPQPTEHGDDNFVLELNREKDKVRTTFMELREILTETETKLMKVLNDILSSYKCYTSEVKKMNEQKRDIENIRNAHLTVVPASPALITFHEKFLQDLNEQLNQLQTPVKPKLMTFACDENKLLSEVNELCKLVERVSEIDYKSKTQSIISVCDRGTGNEQLNYPYGVTVDHTTGNIYVANRFNNCVKVFDNTARYLFKFGDGKGEGKMSNPIGLLISGNRVLVTQNLKITQYNNYIQVYELDGKLVRYSWKWKFTKKYNSPFLSVYQQMNTMVIFIFVIVVTIVFKLSLETLNTNLSSVKIFSTTLMMPNSTKTISLS